MRIVILGCGSIGRRHLQNLQSLGYTELLAYDPASRARRMTREETGLPSHTSLDVENLSPTTNPISSSLEALKLALAVRKTETGFST